MEHRLLVVGDIHLVNSGSAPGYRSETYTDDLFRKLEETVQLVQDPANGVTGVVWLGDVFDHKAPSKTSFALVDRVQELLLSYGVPVYVLIGNHDISSGTLSTLPKQPVNMLRHVSNVTLAIHDEIMLDGEVSLLPLPGIPLEREGDEWLESFKFGSKAKRRIGIVHQLIVPDIEKERKVLQDAFYCAKKIASVTDAHMILFGDLHSKSGVFKAGDVPFINMGSICRMSSNDVDHVPEVYILTIRDDETRSVAPIERFILKSTRPASEVYRLEEHYEAKEHQADIDETIRRINTGSIHKFSIDALAEEIQKNESVTPPVRDKAIDLIESVR